MGSSEHFDFLTGSVYDGGYDLLLKRMQGFGCYAYPDGSKYRGYFQDGKFHGYGYLHLAKPYGFTVKGQFEEGELKQMEHMSFDDGLRVEGKPHGRTLNFSEWRYCGDEDRRFPLEIANGLRAVGPNSLTTRQHEERKLLPGEYDTEEGVYRPQTGFLVSRPEPYTRLQFLGCQKNIRWIERYCRKGFRLHEHREPSEKVCHKTMEANIEAQNLMDLKNRDKCAVEQKPGHKYFSKLYAMELEEARKFIDRNPKEQNKKDDEFVDVKNIPRDISESRSSFSDKPVFDIDWQEECAPKNSLMGRSNISLSMYMSDLNHSQTLFG